LVPDQRCSRNGDLKDQFARTLFVRQFRPNREIGRVSSRSFPQSFDPNYVQISARVRPVLPLGIFVLNPCPFLAAGNRGLLLFNEQLALLVFLDDHVSSVLHKAFPQYPYRLESKRPGLGLGCPATFMSGAMAQACPKALSRRLLQVVEPLVHNVRVFAAHKQMFMAVFLF